MLKILVILTYFTQISIAQVVDTTGEKQCYYCGLVDNCAMPYNVEGKLPKFLTQNAHNYLLTCFSFFLQSAFSQNIRKKHEFNV